MSIEEFSRDQVLKYRIKVKLHQKFVYVFLAMGIGVFAFFYYGLMAGDIKAMFTNPTTAIILAMAFLPAFLFSLHVKKLEAKLNKMMKKLEESSKSSK